MTIIKKYNITDNLIGRGSFASVYKANDIENDIIYAVKKISIQKENNKRILENELSLLRNLHHINIINIHDIIQDKDNIIYLVLDYFKNGDLSNFLNGKSLKEKYCQKYAIQLKNGLEYLYKKNIIHRDLKPQNILVSDSYILKITDFGFAKYFTENMMIQTMCGSPLYMAPEIMKKNKYNIKSDLWSLGIIIYEMLYGTVPFKGKNIIELSKNIYKKQLDFKNLTLSYDCKFLLIKLLDKNPEKRADWDFIFNYNWLNDSMLQKNENNLLEISFNSIPNLNKFSYNNNENQFNSFKYESVYSNNSLEFNFNLRNTSESNIELSESYTEQSDEDSFKSCDENFSPVEEKEYNFVRSKAIDIDYKSNSLNSYIIVNSKNNKTFKSLGSYTIINEKKKSLSESFKEYLKSSINFVKHSYEYISKSSI